MKKAKNIIIFPNGNIAVCDKDGQQIPELQQPWLNFVALRKLAKIIVKDSPEVKGFGSIPTDALNDYIKVYRDLAQQGKEKDE